MKTRIKRTHDGRDTRRGDHDTSRRQTAVRVLCYIEFEENNQEYSLSPVPTAATGRASRWSCPRRAPVQCGRFGGFAAAPSRCPYKWSHSPRHCDGPAGCLTPRRAIIFSAYGIFKKFLFSLTFEKC